MPDPRLFLVAALACAVPACSDDDDVLIDPVGVAVNDGQLRGSVLADTALGELGGADYSVVIGKTASIVAAINDGEIAQNDFARQVVFGDDIAAFAARNVDDHAAANEDLVDVVRIFGVGFIPSDTEADIVAQGSLGLENLMATPPSEIDFEFVELQVKNHASNMVVLDQLRAMVADDEMGFFLDDMLAMEDIHLQDSSDLYLSFF